MQKDYNEILMGLNIKGWCHSMNHETEDDIQDAYMVALDFIKKHPNNRPSKAYMNVSHFFERKYRNDITFVSLEEFLANNSEYKTLPPTEIEELYEIDKNLHYKDLVYFIIDHYTSSKHKCWNSDPVGMKNQLSQKEYRELLLQYCSDENIVKYIICNNIKLTRELVIFILYFYTDCSSYYIAKEFNINSTRVQQILAKTMRKIRGGIVWDRVFKCKFYPIDELFY